MLKSFRAKYRLRQFIASWIEYKNLVLGDLAGDDTLAEKEERFLKLKARLATHLQILEDSVPSSISAEAHREMGEITDQLKRYKSLAERRDWSESERENFERKWHEQYIWLNKLKGAALEKKKVEKRPKAQGVPTGLEKSWTPRRRDFVRPLRFLFLLALLLAVFYVVSWGLGVRRVDGSFTAEETSRFGGAVANILNGADGMWLSALAFFSPVIALYGLGWTIALFVLLLLVLAYWILARG